MEPVLNINLKHLALNYRKLKLLVKQQASTQLSSIPLVSAVVKSNAYGLGIEAVAPVLAQEGCQHFFTAFLAEALVIRRLLPASLVKIFVLAGIFKGQEEIFIKHKLSPVLNDPEQGEIWLQIIKQAHASGCHCAIHLDTGMSRLGFQAADVESAVKISHQLCNKQMPPLLLSHLSSAEAPQNPRNESQLSNFKNLTQSFPQQLKHCLANSSGCFLGQAYHFHMVRPGVALYGGNPTPGQANPMLDVVSLFAPLIQIRTIPAGASVGYNENWIAKRETTIATLPLGYADGLHRSFEGKLYVFYKTRPVKVVGRISMDTVTLDVTDFRNHIRIGDRIEIIGPNNSIEKLAQAAQTIPYELLTSLGKRYQRVYQNP